MAQIQEANNLGKQFFSSKHQTFKIIIIYEMLLTHVMGIQLIGEQGNNEWKEQ